MGPVLLQEERWGNSKIKMSYTYTLNMLHQILDMYKQLSRGSTMTFKPSLSSYTTTGKL